ncbi:hypothetical protein C8Q80DRAFT_1140698 [Daedaleopsis nitida]|nr:hypothetical protein C8Q80DRAFT_1140698 [Daedaleopsis nitida]
MSSTTRPKPRPRPRPRAPAAPPVNTDVPPSSSPGPSSATTSAQTPQATPASQTIEDEDALFLRNQTRTAQTWKQISKMTQEKETRKRKSSSSDTSDDDNRGGSPRSRNKKKKTTKKKNGVLPKWTNKRPKEIILSSDSDDDIVIENKPSKTASKGGRGSSPDSKNKRERSRSITPPPALPQYAIQRAREAVQQFVGARPRAPSPTDFADESTDTIILDPELAKIARRVQSEGMRGTTPVVESGGPEEVRIRVVWKLHPCNPNGVQETWGITQKRHDNFYLCFDEVADLASIRADSLIVCYEGKRVFPSSTPHSIGIWAEAELEACDKSTYEYIQANKRMRSPSVAPAGGDSLRLSPSRGRSQSILELAESDSEKEESPPHYDEGQSNTFHLTVRSARTDKDISLLVRPTTKCGAIVRAFLKKAGLEKEYPMNAAPASRWWGKAAAQKDPALSVDGDKMDPDTEIGEADLDDGDLVEIVGL